MKIISIIIINIKLILAMYKPIKEMKALKEKETKIKSGGCSCGCRLRTKSNLNLKVNKKSKKLKRTKSL